MTVKEAVRRAEHMFCEFCSEFRKPSISRFGQVYRTYADDRIVAQCGDLVAMPTIGQLFPGSLLVLPKFHTETMSSLPNAMLQELEVFLADLVAVISQNGPVISFEHGARCTTGGGCGIYHAHMHIVPLPMEVSIDELLPSNDDLQAFKAVSSLSEGLYMLRSSPEYLIVRDSEYNVRFADIQSLSGHYPSQYFRRVLSELFNLEDSWDWRNYNTPEQYLLDTIEMFRNPDVSLCK